MAASMTDCSMALSCSLVDEARVGELNAWRAERGFGLEKEEKLGADSFASVVSCCPVVGVVDDEERVTGTSKTISLSVQKQQWYVCVCVCVCV